jgi:hypothetical protein
VRRRGRGMERQERESEREEGEGVQPKRHSKRGKASQEEKRAGKREWYLHTVHGTNFTKNVRLRAGGERVDRDATSEGEVRQVSEHGDGGSSAEDSPGRARSSSREGSTGAREGRAGGGERLVEEAVLEVEPAVGDRHEEDSGGIVTWQVGEGHEEERPRTSEDSANVVRDAVHGEGAREAARAGYAGEGTAEPRREASREALQVGVEAQRRGAQGSEGSQVGGALEHTLRELVQELRRANDQLTRITHEQAHGNNIMQDIRSLMSNLVDHVQNRSADLHEPIYDDFS